MKSVPLIILGVLINCVGFCFFGSAVIHRSMANGAAAAGLLDGTIALLLINGGICLIVLGLQRRDGP
jgi:hypothetical protein